MQANVQISEEAAGRKIEAGDRNGARVKHFLGNAPKHGRARLNTQTVHVGFHLKESEFLEKTGPQTTVCTKLPRRLRAFITSELH